LRGKDQALLTVPDNVAVHVFANLKKRWPFGVVLKVEAKLVCLSQRVEVAFRELVDVVRPEPPEARHGVRAVTPGLRMQN